MYIDRLELEGFKSFASRTKVQFCTGISGVVGSNGCGKSNIVDAIKWCLGEQSAKSLRGKMMTDVIFNGSATQKPCSFAEVSLVFHKGNSEFKGIFAGLDEVQVTRKLNQQGVSTYYLNHSKVRLRDVQLFFMDTGLYNQQYAVIEQGQIGQIVNARPSQTRLLFEEAAGILRFKESKESAEQKLFSTRENLEKVSIIEDGLFKQLSSLQRQAQKAVLHRRLSSVLRQLSISLALAQYKQGLEDRAVLSQQEKNLIEEESTLENTNRRQWSMMVQAKQSLTAKQEENNRFNKQLQTAVKSQSQVQTSLEYQQKELASLKANHNDLASTLESTQVDLAHQEHQLSTLAQQVLISESQMKEASHARALAIEAHTQATRAIKDTDAQINNNKTQSDQARNRISKIDGELTAIEHRLQDLQKDGVSRAAELTRNQQNQTEQQQILHSAQNRLKLQEAAAKNAEIAFQEAQSKLQAFNQDLQKSKALLKSAQIQYQESDGRRVRSATKLQSLQRMLLAHEGVPKDTQKVLQHSEAYGLLPEFLDVPKEIEAQFLLALGEDMDCILVKSLSAFAELLPLCKGRTKLFLLAEDSDSSSQNVMDFGPFQQISGEIFALKAVSKILGKVIEISNFEPWMFLEQHCTFVHPKSQSTLRNGMLSTGKVASVAAELLHRRREIVAEQEILAQLDRAVLQKQEELNQARNAVLELEKQLELFRQNEIQMGQTLRNLQQGIQEIKGEIDSSNREIATLQRLAQNQIQYQQQVEREKIQKNQQKENFQTEKSGLEKQTVDLDVVLRSLQEQRQQEMRHAGQVSQKRSESDSLCQVLSERLIQSKKLHDQVRKSCSSLHLRISQVQMEMDKSTQRQEFLESNNVELQSQMDNSTGLLEDLRLKIDASLQGIAQWVKYTEDLESKLQSCQQEKEKISKKRAKVQQDLDKVHSKVALLKQRILKDFECNLSEQLAIIQKQQQLVFQPLDGVLALEPESEEDKEMTLPFYVVLGDLDNEEIHQQWQIQIADLERHLQKLGSVNFMAIEEGRQIQEEYDIVHSQKSDLEDSMQQIMESIAELNDLCSSKFLETVDKVNQEFQKIYPQLVGGGSAYVELTEPEQPLETGVNIIAEPPGKRLQRLSLLSGGERAMVAIALLFSLFHVKPSPVCLMDEVDAPLDEANGERFNTMLKEMATRSQFIVITHNKKTMEAMDVLYGVSMPTPGVSQLVSVQFD